MDDYASLNHTRWECRVPCGVNPEVSGRKALYASLRRDLGPVFKSLAEQRESTVEEGQLIPIMSPCVVRFPEARCLSGVSFIKGKAAIHIARTYQGKKQRSWELCFVLVFFGVLNLLILLWFASYIRRIDIIQDSLRQTVILLTVLANRQGATQANHRRCFNASPTPTAKAVIGWG